MKLTKIAAEYVNKAKKDYCKDCTMFRPAKADGGTAYCTLVGGVINPIGHCKYFERKNKLKVYR